MSATNGQHPWLLAAPWYGWPRQAPVQPRETRPVLQKYETSRFVTEFLRDPQHSLKFVDEDLVHRLELLPPLPALGPPFGTRRRRLSTQTLVKTGTRKLFLDTHKRFYLVVCELHCDAPGFPSANRDQVCEAGLVVRRRRVEVGASSGLAPKIVTKQAAGLLRDIAMTSTQLENLERIAALSGSEDDGLVASIRFRRADAVARLGAERRRLAAWSEEVGSVWALEGWLPSAFDKIGRWQQVEESPGEVTEQVYPLYPLVPDPRDAGHAGRARAIYFGVVPTSSAEAAVDGTARFDDQALYEVRCYVRRHDPRCPKKPVRGDCKGELVWSHPTETYRLASHFDLDGTGNQPVTIQLPDIPALQARAATARPSQLATVKMVSPPGSGFQFADSGKIPTSGGMNPGIEICSFSIPLITIVATFVFKLFLGIVMLVFNLWFLLKLKFCIPPSAQVAGDVGAELSLIPPSLSVDADIDVAMSAPASAALQAKLSADFDAEQGAGTGAALTGPAGYTNKPLIELHKDLAADYRLAANAPSFTETLEYEDHVDRSEVTVS